MIVGNRKWLSVWWSVLISQKYLAMINIFQISHIQGNKVFLDTDIWLRMESWFLLSETFYWFIYIEIITYTYQNSIRVLFLHLITIVGREWRITKDTIARDNPVSYSQLLYKNWDTCVHPLHTHRSWLLLSLGPGGGLLLQSSSHCWTL